MKNIVPTPSKMSLKILNFEKTLFPALQEELGVLSFKEEKLMRILELAQMKKEKVLKVKKKRVLNYSPDKKKKKVFLPLPALSHALKMGKLTFLEYCWLK